MANNNEEIVAVVSPRSIGGVSLFEAIAPITADNVREFHSEAADIAAASNELRKLGFSVLQEGPATTSIGGSRKQFEEVFGAKLRKKTAEVMEGQKVAFYAAPEEPAEQLLQPPEALTNLIEGVALSVPPIYYQSPSPLPPLAPPDPAAYRYLFVPDEVGLVLYAARVHRVWATGKGVKVAMCDTGFYRHPFYSWHGYRVSSTVLGPGATDPTKDDYSHGTGEAANIFATAPDAELIPVKMGAPVGSFNAAVAKNPQVITCSWGLSWPPDQPPHTPTPYASALAAAIASAVASGIVVCFAGGNGTWHGFPAGHPDIISVGGVHVNYPFLSYNDLEASSYASSFDSHFYPGRHIPDLCGLTGKSVTIGGKDLAPSLMLPVQPGSTLDGIRPSTGASDDGWGLFSGTSAACPQVAGIAALMLEKDPTATPADIKKTLKNTATDVKAGSSAMGDPAGPGTDDATGAGLVNAKWAYINTMGSIAAQFFEASPEMQAQMVASGQVPRVSREFVADLLKTLRST